MGKEKYTRGYVQGLFDSRGEDKAFEYLRYDLKADVEDVASEFQMRYLYWLEDNDPEYTEMDFVDKVKEEIKTVDNNKEPIVTLPLSVYRELLEYKYMYLNKDGK